MDKNPYGPLRFNKASIGRGIFVAIFIILFFLALSWLSDQQWFRGNTDDNTDSSSLQTEVPDTGELGSASNKTLTVNSKFVPKGGLFLTPSAQPSTAQAGQIIFNQATDTLQYYDGTKFVELAGGVTSIGGLTGAIVVGQGLSVANGVLTSTVSSSQTLTAGTGLMLDGTTLNNTGVVSIQGTTDQVNVSSSSGSVTLSLPQSIALGSIPTFAGMNLNGNLTVSGNIVANQLVHTGGGQNITIDASGDEIVFTAGGRTFQFPTTGPASQTICTTGVTCVAGGGLAVELGPGSAQTDVTGNPSIYIDNTGGSNLLQLQSSGVDRFVVNNLGNLTTRGDITHTNGSFSTTLEFENPTANATLVIPALAAGTYEICTTDGNCPTGGDIFNNGQTGPVTVGTNNATDTVLETNNTARLTINGTTGAATFSGALTSTGLLTASAGISVNSETFTDLTGTGLQLSGGALQTTLGTSVDLVTEITGTLGVGNGGTGSTNASGARTNLGAAASGANSDITSLSGLTTALSVGQGGTGATTFTQYGVIYGNNAGALQATAAGSTGQCLIATTGAAPSWGACPGAGGIASLTLAGTSGTPQTITDGNTITIAAGTNVNTSAGATDTVTVSVVNNPTFSGLITANGGLTVEAGDTFTFNGDAFTDLTGTGLAVNTGVLGLTGQALALHNLSCSNGQVIKHNGSVLACGTDIDTDTTYSAGNGLQLASTTFSINSPTCAAGEYLYWNGTAFICDTPTGTGAVNAFTTIAAPAGTNPVADSSADTLTLSNGAGITISGDSTTDTVTIAATLGSSVDLTSEVTGTLPIANGGTNATTSQGAINNISQLTTNGDLLYFNGTNSTRLARGTNGQCLTSNATTIAWGSCPGAGGIASLTLAGTSGTPQTISDGDTITVGAGTNISTTAGATDTVTIAVVNNPTFSGLVTANGGLTVEAGDTFTFNGDAFTDLTGTGLAVNTGVLGLTGQALTLHNLSCSNGQVIKHNGTSLACGTDIDTDTTYSAGNGLQLASTTFSINSPTCSPGEYLYWDGTAFVCDTPTGTGATNAFTTIAAPAGTNPVADSVADTLNLSNGSGITITGDSTTDTVTIAATLGTSVDLAAEVTGTLPIANGGTGATDAAGARTNLGATTVGSNIFTLTNPSAVTFLRINADNTVSTLDASSFRSAIGAGTVTSVDVSGGTTGLTTTGGPVTGSGTITLAGTLAIANGGTGATTSQGAINAISQLTTQGDLLYHNGTNSTRLARGTDGQCLTSNATTIVWASCPGAGGISSLTLAGTSGTPQTISDGDTITIAAGTNVVTTGGATDTVTIAVVSNPTFSGLVTANGGLTVETGDTFTFNGDAFTDLTGSNLTINSGVLNVLSNPTFTGLITANGGLTVEAGDTFTFNSDAFTDLTGTGLTISGGALQTTLGTSVDLTSEVTGILPIANGGTNASSASGARTNLGAAASGANADITSTTALNTITPSAALTVGATSQSFTLQGTAGSTITATDTGNTTTIGFVTPTADVTINFPALGVGTYEICTTSGNCLGGGSGGANTSLSNLSGVAINTSLLPGSSTIDLGSDASPFRSAYLSSSIIFEGSTADVNEITLSAVDPTADIVYRFADAAAGTYDICTTAGNCVGGGGGGAPNNAAYITLGNDGTLSNERAITAGTNLSGTDGGANSTYTLNVVNNPTFTGLVTANGGLTVETGDTFTFNGDAFTDLTGTGLTISSGSLQTTLGTSVDLTSEVTNTLPIANGGTNATTSQGAINNISQLTTNGDLLYHNGTNSTRLARGSDGQCLTSNTTTIIWASCPGSGGVASLTLAGTSGSSQTITDGDTITIAAGTNVTTTAGATDTVTIAVVNNPTFSGLITANGGITSTTGTFSGDVASNANTTLGDAATDLLTINAVIQGSNALVFEGSTADGFETTVAITDPTADRTITLPDASGTVAVSASGNIALSAAGNITFTGQLPIANGGTGASTSQGAINAISQLTTQGDLLYHDGTNSTRLARGSDGQCLTSNTTTIVWASCPGAGGISSLTLAGTSGTPQALSDGNTITIAAGSNVSTTAGATDTVTVAVVSNPTFTGLVTANGGLTVETGDTFTFNGDAFTDLTGTNLAISTGVLSVVDNPTFTGLVTANGGLTVEAGDTFTFNGDAFTDLTGTGLTISGGALQTTLGTSVDLTSEVTGTLPIANGGTNATTSQGAINNISQLTTNGDLLYHNGTNSTRLARGSDTQCLLSNTTTITWGTCTGDGVGVTTVGALDGGTPNANGATISTNTIYLQSASGTNPGLVNTTTQTFAGNKTFSGTLTVSGATTINNTLSVSGTAPDVNQAAVVTVDAQLTSTSNNQYGMAVETEANPSSSGSANSFVGFAASVNNSSGSVSNDGLIGISGSVSLQGTSGATDLAGGVFGVTNTGSGTVADAVGLSVVVVNAGAGSITNGVGVSILDIPTATNNTNLLISGSGSAAGNWSIYNASTADNVFGGDLRIGSTTAPTVALDVTGSALVSGTLGITGLTTLNGGLTVEAGDTFTFNSDAFTDLTGTGLTISSGSLQTTLGTSVDLTSEVTGTLPIANGGTNATTSQGAINNISQLTTNGDLLYHNGTNSTRLARGTNTQCLLSNTTTITWGTCTGDGVGVTTVGALDGGTPNANGATISSTTIYLQSASGTNPGLVNTTTQTFAGDKTFSGATTVNNTLTVSGTAPDVLYGAAATINGTLTSTTNSQGGLTVNSTISPSGATNLSHSGVIALATSSSANLNAGNNSGIYGFNGGGIYTGTSTIRVVGGGSVAYANLGSGTITHGRGIYVADGSNVGGGTITNGVGVLVQEQTAATNNVNLLIRDALTMPTGNWNIFSDSTYDSALAGNLSIGSTSAPTVALDVTGAGAFSGALTVTGLTTLNGGLTVEAGDTFTFNGDAFTDLTGTGLTISGGALQTTLGTSVDLTSEVTGTLPIANGGTNATTSQGAINNLSQLTTNGDLLYHNGTNSTRLARGSDGQCLTSNTTTIVWASCPGAGGLSGTLTDNIANAWDIQEGTNNYININTTNTSENISFGNTTTNPSYNFLGTGLAVFGGDVTINDDLAIIEGLDVDSGLFNIDSTGDVVSITSNDDFAFIVQNVASVDIFWVDAATEDVHVGNDLQVGDNIDAAGTVTIGTGTNTNATANGELYVAGDIEVDGTSYLASATLSGTLAVTGATTINNTLAVTTTVTNAGAAQSINVTLGNDADADDVAGLAINATNVATGDADSLGGLWVNDLAGSGVSSTYAIGIGTGWGTDIWFGKTNAQLEIQSSLYVADTAGNTLLTIADGGTTGNLTVTGNINAAGDLYAAFYAVGEVGLAVGDGSSNYTDIISASQSSNYSVTIPTLSGNDSFCLATLANCGGGGLSATLTDNVANAWDIQEGTNNYININTTNTSENISFGNATTNPSFSFLGSGTFTVTGAALFQGGISAPGTGTDSEAFGLGATADGDDATALGFGATADGISSIGIGSGAIAASNTSIAIGFEAATSGDSGIALGAFASAANSGIGIGVSASTGADSVAIGSLSTASNYASIAIGSTASAHEDSIAIGVGATTSAAGQLVLGSDGWVVPISQYFFGTSPTAANAASRDVVLNATGGSGTDIGGADFTLAGGRGTGTGAGGAIIFQTATAGSTGTSLNSLTTRMTIQGGGGVVIDSGSLTVGTSSQAGSLAISDGSSNTATIQAQATSGNYTYTIPTTTANDTFCLATLANCGGGGLSATLTDNTANAWDIQEGTNNYININTTNSSENISFGNSTTNPSFNFLGTGTLTVSGATAINNTLTVTTTLTNTSAAQEINVTLGNDGGIDDIYGLYVDVTSASTGDADSIGGIWIGDVTSPDATVYEYGLGIGSGYDANLIFGDTTSVVELADTGTLTLSAGANTLLTVTDAGTTGNLTVTGDIVVDDITADEVDANWFVAAAGVGIGDGSSNYIDILSASQSLDYSVTIPTLSGNDTFCLQTLANCGGGLSASLTDNTANAWDVQEGSNNYININTTNASENISFGNTTTNPTFNFLGTGALTVSGATTINNTLAVTTSSTSTAQAISLTSTSGTQTAGLSITRSGVGGTTTSLLALTQSGGTATNGILFSGTIGTDITTASGRALTLSAGGTGDISMVLDDDTNLALSGTRTNTGAQQTIALTLGNDTAVDTVSALQLNVTSAATGDADILQGIDIANLTSANATVIERALQIGSGWDANLFFNDTTTQIQVANTGVITFEDDAGNDLLTVTDSGSTGTIAVNGNLAVTSTQTNDGTGSQVINVTLGNDADADAVTGLGIFATSTATGDADGLSGIFLQASSPQASVHEAAIVFGTNWDTDLYFSDTTGNIKIANTGNILIEDDAGNDLVVITDTGTRGNLSVTGTGNQSEQFGASANASGDYSVALGNSASAERSGAIAIGYSSLVQSGTSDRGVAIGYDAYANDGGVALGAQAGAYGGFGASIALGNGSLAADAHSIALGTNAVADGTNDYYIAIGNSSTAAGSGTNIALGHSSVSDGSGSIAIGQSADSGYTASIAIGREATTVANNQFVVGSDSYYVNAVVFGGGVVTGNAASRDVTIAASSGFGTDIGGADLTLSGGLSTGNAAGGSLIFNTTPAGASGSSFNTPVARLTIDSTGASVFTGTVGYANGTADTNTAVCRNAAGQLAGCTSSQRYKTDVQATSFGLNELRMLQPVSYTWTTNGKADLGFIAEQVASVIPQAVTYDGNGEVASFNPTTITAVLTSSVKQLDVQVQNHESRIAALEAALTGNLPSLHVSGASVFDGNVTFNGKLITGGALATITKGAQAGADSTVSISGNDTAGEVTYVAGSSTSGEQIVVNFSSPYGAQPRVILTPSTPAAASIRYYVERTTTQFKIHFIDTPVAGQTYKFDYIVIQ